eukprot:TRINITY_DN10302_c0_g1_i1.p3 TRINITY_DN10302_c0_g1~~TRINITY_DN10302_c0_g1_i1.p3  ORF type:complete len:105 (-),score=6.69 TRINITY_DN10302_c0_g1_i1:853-1167(-)
MNTILGARLTVCMNTWEVTIEELQNVLSSVSLVFEGGVLLTCGGGTITATKVLIFPSISSTTSWSIDVVVITLMLIIADMAISSAQRIRHLLGRVGLVVMFTRR